MTAVLTDKHVLVVLDEQFDASCDYPSCNSSRTHLLTCPECPAAENMCEAHTFAALNAPPQKRVMFVQTCLHVVLMADCGKIRIQ